MKRVRRVVVAAWLLAFWASADAQDAAPPAKPAELKIVRKLAGPVEGLALSPDGKWIAAAGRSDELTLFSTSDDAKKAVSGAAAAGDDVSRFDSLVFTEDSAYLAVVRWRKSGGDVAVVSVADGKVVRDLAFTESDSLHHVGAEPGGSKLRFLCQQTMSTIDAATGEKSATVKNDPYAQRRVVSADKSLAACGVISKFWVVDAVGKERWRVDLNATVMKGSKVDVMTTATCHVLGFTADKRMLVVRAETETIKDPTSLTGKNIDQRTTKTSRILGYGAADGKSAWKRDVPESVTRGDVCVAGDVVAFVSDGKITLVNAATGQTRDTLSGSTFTCVAGTVDGLTFWAGSEDGQVAKAKVYAAPKGK
jgi:WD40 repeat protein